MATGSIDETDIRSVVERFYNEVRSDKDLNEAFAAVTDWDDHLLRMTEFWSALMLATGRYKGNPVAMHLIHAAHIRPEMFERWLALWSKAASDTLPRDAACEIIRKAERVASRLSAALFGAEDTGLVSASPPLSSRPYRSTPVFTEDTIPEPLLRSYTFRPGTWAKLDVLEGSLRCHLHRLPMIDVRAGSNTVIPPQLVHHLEITGPVRCRLHFYDHQPNVS